MLNELSLYVLVVRSAHQKSSVYSAIQGSVDWAWQYWWDKPASKLEDRLIINHLCTTVQHSDAFQHLSFLGKVNFFSYQSFTTCGLHAVSRRETLPSITAYSKYLCGQLDSAVAVGSHHWYSNTLAIISCFTLFCSSVAHLFCYSVKRMWWLFEEEDVFLLSVDFCLAVLNEQHELCWYTEFEWAMNFVLLLYKEK